MERFTVLNGLVAPLDRANVDTDQIIPKQFLKSIKRTGFGTNLFDAWRYLDEGQPDQPHASRTLNPDFVLNQPRYADASILLARRNFGCGSSREHAPWALDDYGFRAVIAPSFGDIFYSNALKNGLLPIVLPEAVVLDLLKDSTGKVTIDLESQTVNGVHQFDIAPFAKKCLLEGLDEIDFTLSQADRIAAFEKSYQP